MNHCKTCEIKGQCNFIDPRCKLLASEVLTERPDLIQRYWQTDAQAAVTQKMVDQNRGTAQLKMRKYDKRRKPDTPQRTLWRIYKRGHRKELMQMVKAARKAA